VNASLTSSSVTVNFIVVSIQEKEPGAVKGVGKTRARRGLLVKHWRIRWYFLLRYRNPLAII